MFTCDQDTENFNRLVTVIKQRLHAGQGMQEIVTDLIGPATEEWFSWNKEAVFFAHHSALILVKDENEFYGHA